MSPVSPLRTLGFLTLLPPDLLGAQKPSLARVASRVTIFIAIVVSGLNSIMLVLLRNVWGHLFSSDKEIIVLVANVLPIVAAFQLCDGLSGAMGGVLRGAGKPTLGAIVSPLSASFCSQLPPAHLAAVRRSTPRATTSSDSPSASHSPSQAHTSVSTVRPPFPLSITRANASENRSLDRPHRRTNIHRPELDVYCLEDGLGGRG